MDYMFDSEFKYLDISNLNTLKVSEQEIKSAYDVIDESLLKALKQAKENIYNFYNIKL